MIAAKALGTYPQNHCQSRGLCSPQSLHDLIKKFEETGSIVIDGDPEDQLCVCVLLRTLFQRCGGPQVESLVEWLVNLTAASNGPGLNSREGMDDYKCIKLLQHGSILNIRRAASLLKRLVEEEKRWKTLDKSLLRDIKPKCTVTSRVQSQSCG
ncbi:hypothetical protein TNCV_3159781 [Trichonephila clavipes]|nr:hypothetical protein TNCV_3159781 [Trichonephila clavipes]